MRFIVETMSLVVAVSFLQAACSSMPKEVYVPVSAPEPKVIIPDKPYLPINDLKPDSSPDIVIKSYVASIKLTQDHCDELEHILKAYE